MANQNDLLDSHIGQIIRNSVRPVLVAGQEFNEGGEVRNIVVAYDGSNHAARSLLVAAELASRPGVNCRLVNISASQEEGEEVLAPADAFMRHHGIVPTKQVVVHAKPSDVISSLASEKDVDLLIMGAYGRRPIREVIFGSTTEKVLAHSSVNVLLQS
jgi:nucleotide-binding universal stress UspA family protein